MIVSWDAGHLRVRGAVRAEATLEVRPRTDGAVPDLPAMSGRVERDGDDLCFVPRFDFVPGTSYTVRVDGVDVATLTRPATERPSTTDVLGIYPQVPVVPRNLLRCYVRFSAPMSEGFAARHVHLVDSDVGDVIENALLPSDYELWDATRTQLTVLLDPARIKRGLVTHRRLGYPLQVGQLFRLTVDREFPDFMGNPLVSSADRQYRVGLDERRRVEPAGWQVTSPASGTLDPLTVEFDRPLDHALLQRCLRVTNARRRPLRGMVEIQSGQRCWQFTPLLPWARETHQIVVEEILEDLAGNSVQRVFDRDLAQAEDPATALDRRILRFTPVPAR